MTFCDVLEVLITWVMVGGVDRRSQALKATRRWKAEWMEKRERQGDKVGAWAVQVDLKTFCCRWCNTVRLELFLRLFCKQMLIFHVTKSIKQQILYQILFPLNLEFTTTFEI